MWDKNEDLKLVNLVRIHGPHNWKSLSRYFTNKTGKQCRERYFNHLDERLQKKRNSIWSYEEDKQLYELQKKYGNRWKLISCDIDGRAENQVKNRFHSAAFKAQIPIFKQNYQSQNQLFSSFSGYSNCAKVVTTIPDSPTLSAATTRSSAISSSSALSPAFRGNIGHRRSSRSSISSGSYANSNTNTNSSSSSNSSTNDCNGFTLSSPSPSASSKIQESGEKVNYNSFPSKILMNVMKDADELISSADAYLAKEKEKQIIRNKFGTPTPSTLSLKYNSVDDFRSNYNLRSTWVVNETVDGASPTSSSNSLNDLTDEHSLQLMRIRPKHKLSESTISSNSIIELLSYGTLSDDAMSLTEEEANILLDFMNSGSGSGSRSGGSERSMRNHNVASNNLISSTVAATTTTTTTTTAVASDTPFSPIIARSYTPFSSSYDGIHSKPNEYHVGMDISGDDRNNISTSSSINVAGENSIFVTSNLSFLSDLTERSNSDDSLNNMSKSLKEKTD